MNKPVICFDFDGTLVDRHGIIHPRDVDILRHEDRVTFIPATGRLLHSVRHAFDRNGLFLNGPIPLPMVLQNGAVVYFPDEVVHSQTVFSADEQTALLDISRRYPQICCLLFSLDQVDILGPNSGCRQMVDRFDLDVQPFRPNQTQYTKITFIADAPGAMNQLVTDLAELPVELFFSLPTVLELNRRDVNKGRMLTTLLNDLGWQSAPVLTAGDGENDLSLFEVADISFCPDDSPPLIKARADLEINIAQTGLLAPMLTKIENMAAHCS